MNNHIYYSISSKIINYTTSDNYDFQLLYHIQKLLKFLLLYIIHPQTKNILNLSRDIVVVFNFSSIT